MIYTYRFRSRKVDLRGKIAGAPGIEFLEMDLYVHPPSPLGRVYIARDGVPQAGALRIDLDKRIFLDHFDDPAIEAAIQNAARQIVAYVGQNEPRPTAVPANLYIPIELQGGQIANPFGD